jgi:hypothetical protein
LSWTVVDVDLDPSLRLTAAKRYVDVDAIVDLARDPRARGPTSSSRSTLGSTSTATANVNNVVKVDVYDNSTAADL